MSLNHSRGQRAGLALAALALVGAVVFASTRTGPLAPIKITVAQPTQGSVIPTLFGIGTVEARRSWLIGPTAPGRVRRVTVDVGDVVHAGQVLADIDPVDLDQRLAALDASVARARSAQQAAQAQQADAQARLRLANANAQRNQDLARQQFISPTALESRLQEQASAQAALAGAQANAQAAAQDATRLRAEHAALAQQRASLQLRAPAAAVVSSRDLEPGSAVAAGQSVLRLIAPDSLWVRLRIDQGRAQGLAPGLPARITLRSQPALEHVGTVARVEWLADAVTEERLAQVAFRTVPQGVSVGEMAEVTLQLPAAAPGLLIPNAAVQRQGGQTGVWLLQNDAPTFAPVRLGATSADGQVQVLDGLSERSRLVVYSEKALKAGARVKVVDALVPNAHAEAKP